MALSVAERSRRYREAHPERAKASGAAWIKRNPGKAKLKNDRWRAANPEKVKAWNRDPALKSASAKRSRARRSDHIKAYMRKRCDERRAWFETLKTAPCTDCGGTFPPVCMDFDHVRGEKSRCVGNLFNVSKDRVFDEIAKCDLVCANCHRLRTAARRTRRQVAA